MITEEQINKLKPGDTLISVMLRFLTADEWQMDAIIDTFSEDACLSDDELRRYWSGARRPGLIFVKEATPDAYPVRWEGGRHPQNFIYLKG